MPFFGVLRLQSTQSYWCEPTRSGPGGAASFGSVEVVACGRVVVVVAWVVVEVAVDDDGTPTAAGVRDAVVPGVAL